MQALMDSLQVFIQEPGRIVMMVIGGILMYLGIKKEYEPTLLVPIGLGTILVNFPFSGVLMTGNEKGPFQILFEAGINTELFPLLLFIGIGADRYTHPDFNTIPIYGTFRYSPITKIPKGYLYTNLGYGCFANEAISSGWMWDLGIGYTKMFRKHFGLNFQIGYNLKEFADIPSYRYDIDSENTVITYLGKVKDLRHSLSFGIGMVF